MFNVIAIALLIVALSLLAFLIYFQWGRKRRVNELVERDINGGYKKIITRQVDSQHITGQEERTALVYGGANRLRREIG